MSGMKYSLLDDARLVVAANGSFEGPQQAKPAEGWRPARRVAEGSGVARSGRRPWVDRLLPTGDASQGRVAARSGRTGRTALTVLP
jgi:hypothetical protein